MHRITKAVFVTIILTMLGGILPLLLPTPDSQMYIPYHLHVTIPLMSAIPDIAGAIILLLAIRDFTPRLKRAYFIMSAGFIVLAIGLVQSAILPLLGLERTDWATMGGLQFPFLISPILVYFGQRSFAKLFGVNNLWTNPVIALSTAAAILIITSIVPHGPTQLTQFQFAVTAGSVAAPTSLFLWGGILIYYIRKRTSPLYMPAMKWLFWATVSGTLFVAVPYLVVFLWQPDNQAANTVFILQIFSGFVFVKAAVEFNRISASEQSNPGEAFSRRSTAIDAVMYVASLASNPKEIDTIMDKVRLITSSLDSNGMLGYLEQTALYGVYLQLEEYFTEKEPVRKFSKAKLRGLIYKRFGRAESIDVVFWEQLKLH
ncbi:MAG TPA: hypothetical protein VNX65_04040 [Patescibacteria group bacterium]|jgi:hypothetical protein|nr:hypothetical protein [Patescibacteria group bacterium]